ncbi:YbeD family protein [Thioalkalivibrio sp.]|uniref:YbeD family protein n=1 Tax=Thioalkalivibrio sp. TaxID=2093813 RepID=UPI003974D2A4
MAEDRESLLEFPCRFPIKVMGEAHPEFLADVEACIARHLPDRDSVDVVQRESRGGNYVGVTITLTATSQEQLDTLYRALGECARVRMVL